MKDYFEIVDVLARAVSDSGHKAALEVEVTLDDGTTGRASVVSSALSRPVNIAVENVNGEIAEALNGLNVLDQTYIDQLLLELDGTENYSRLGSNALLAVSMACARAGALALGLPLYNYLGGVNAKVLPQPVFEEQGKFFTSSASGSFQEAVFSSRKNYEVKSIRTLSSFVTVTEAIDVLFSSSDLFSEDATFTGDSFPADLSVALNRSHLLIYSTNVTNQLLRIEEELFDAAVYKTSNK